MLEFIRKKANSRVFKVLLSVLALTFIFCFGMFDIIRRWTGKDYLVKIGSVKITPVMFNIEKAKKLNTLHSQQKNFDEKVETNKILHQIIWENIIDQAASKVGFVVSERTIKEYIAGMGIFRDKDGRFNSAMLRRFLQNINVSEPMFIEFSGKDIKNALIKAPFRYVSVGRSVDSFTRALLEKRTLEYVEINPDSISLTEKPTPEELEDFYASNQDLFIIDESRSFSLVSFLESDIAKTITVSEEEKKDYYETSPERDDRTYDEMKDEIFAELMQEKVQNAVDEKTRQIEDALMAGENIEDVIKKFNLRVVKITDVAALDKDGKAKSIIKSKYADDILTVAFSTEDGADSSFAEAMDEKGQKVLWLVHVDSITPKHVAPFDKVAEDVKKEWTKKQKHDKAIELAKSFCDGVKEGGKLMTLASKKGKKAFETKAFDRAGNISSETSKENDKNKENKVKSKEEIVAAEFANEAFSAAKGNAFFKEIDGVVIVASVKKVIAAENIDDKTAAQCHVELIKNNVDDLYQQLVGFLSKERYEIKINHEMLDKAGADTSGIEDMF